MEREEDERRVRYGNEIAGKGGDGRELNGMGRDKM